MPIHSLSEGFLRLTYTGTSLPHHAMLPINFEGVPSPGTEPDLTKKDGTSINAEAGLDAFLDVYGNFFNEETLFGLAEIYAVNPETQERTFIYAWNAARNGDDPNPIRPWVRTNMSFKTVSGGRLNIVMMEGVLSANEVLYPPYASASRERLLSDYIVSGESIVIGRDDSYAFTPISLKTKTDDVLRKRAGF